MIKLDALLPYEHGFFSAVDADKIICTFGGLDNKVIHLNRKYSNSRKVAHGAANPFASGYITLNGETEKNFQPKRAVTIARKSGSAKAEVILIIEFFFLPRASSILVDWS